MAVNGHPNGLGGTTDELVTASNFTNSGAAAQVYYVDSAGGDDSNAGWERNSAKATLAAAVTLAADDSIIILLSTHSEEISSTITITDRLTIVGEGVASGKPAAVLINAGGAADAIVFGTGSDGSSIRNIHFKSGADAATPVSNLRNTVEVGATNVLVDGCYFDITARTDDPALEVSSSGNGFICRGCTFAISDGGESWLPIEVIGADYVELSDTVVDSGTGTFTGGSLPGLGVLFTGTCNGVKMRGMSLLNGGGMSVSNATGYFANVTTTGGAQVIW